MRSVPTPLEGIPREFDSVVSVERPALARYFHHAMRDAGLADDLSQETFIRAAQGWGAFRGECSPKTWLRRIATNVLRDHSPFEVALPFGQEESNPCRGIIEGAGLPLYPPSWLLDQARPPSARRKVGNQSAGALSPDS